MHGAPEPEYAYDVRWWLQGNCDGTLVSTSHPNATVYPLIIEYVDKPYRGRRFERYGVQVRPDRMVILDRRKVAR